jgi:uncharacterized protein YecT (DUF1311 family)
MPSRDLRTTSALVVLFASACAAAPETPILHPSANWELKTLEARLHAAPTQMERHEGASALCVFWNARLAEVVERLSLETDDKGREFLAKAQEKWLAFREAETDRIADLFRGGSAAPTQACLSSARMTEERVRGLATSFAE